MDEKLGTFIKDFGALVRLAQAQADPVPGGRQVLQALNAHLRMPANELSVVVEHLPAHRLVDLDLFLESVAARSPEGRVLGIGGGDQRNHMSFSEIIQQSLVYPQFPVSRPDYRNEAVGPDGQRQVVALGLWLFRYDGVPLAVLQRGANPQFGSNFASLEVLAAEPESAAAFLAEVRRHLESNSVFKGQVISLAVNEYRQGTDAVTFIRRPELTGSDVILPDGLLGRVGDHVLGIGRQAQTLKAHGQHLKRGVLLYGPPGTGKTHTVRYLLSQSEGVTAVLLAGGSLARIAEAAQLARALAPSIVVLEDVDLIAEDRSFGVGPQPLLFEVLDAMDGLDTDTDVAFVLTTNRVDMLERALAQRPGRVDLAVEIPLPSDPERLALLRLYSRGLGFTDAALTAAAARIAGTTASFAKELIRRCVLAASLAGTAPGDGHLAAAVEQLMADGESLTRSLLGSTAAGADGDGQDDAGPYDDGQGDAGAGETGSAGFFTAPMHGPGIQGQPARYSASYEPLDGHHPPRRRRRSR